MTKPNIKIWDIETGHMTVKAWSLWDKFIPIDNIVEDWYIICAAYKDLGKNKVSAVSVLDDLDRFRKDVRDDYHVVAHMHKVLSEADAVIHHFGDAFDIKKFNARAIYHGFDPLPNLIQIDTVKIAKSKFKFSSNKLDYLGEYLGLGRKIPTDNNLWLRCEAGERKAIREMVSYNKQDVELLEAVYEVLKPFVPARLNLNHFSEERVCPTCGSPTLQRRGTARTLTRVYQRYQCTNCGSWSKSVASDKGTSAEIK